MCNRARDGSRGLGGERGRGSFWGNSTGQSMGRHRWSTADCCCCAASEGVACSVACAWAASRAHDSSTTGACTVSLDAAALRSISGCLCFASSFLASLISFGLPYTLCDDPSELIKLCLSPGLTCRDHLGLACRGHLVHFLLLLPHHSCLSFSGSLHAGNFCLESLSICS